MNEVRLHPVKSNWFEGVREDCKGCNVIVLERNSIVRINEKRAKGVRGSVSLSEIFKDKVARVLKCGAVTMYLGQAVQPNFSVKFQQKQHFNRYAPARFSCI